MVYYNIFCLYLLHNSTKYYYGIHYANKFLALDAAHRYRGGLKQEM